MQQTSKQKALTSEIVFQAILLILVFVFYAFDRNYKTAGVAVEPYKIAFFMNYAAAALLINYVLLPKFLYQKKYVHFALCTAAVVALVIFVEEGVIEQIYFPDTRGKGFPGVFANLVTSLPVISILTGFKFAWDVLARQRKMEEMQMLIKESELQYLKSQINPHFLFNNLNNLYAYALEQSPKTPEIILELSDVLRYMLYDCKASYVYVKQELAQLQNFVRLSELQIEERGEVEFKSEIEDDEFLIAPLILNVFVENAFKHSLSSKAAEMCIKIKCQLRADGAFTFSCQNSFSAQTNAKQLAQGIGLENVKKRLNMIYSKSHTLTITDADGWYAVQLKINLHKQSR